MIVKKVGESFLVKINQLYKEKETLIKYGHMKKQQMKIMELTWNEMVKLRKKENTNKALLYFAANLNTILEGCCNMCCA